MAPANVHLWHPLKMSRHENEYHHIKMSPPKVDISELIYIICYVQYHQNPVNKT